MGKPSIWIIWGPEMKELLPLWIYCVVTSAAAQFTQHPQTGLCFCRRCPDPRLAVSDEAPLKPAHLGQFIRTLLGVRWKGDVTRQNMTACSTSPRWRDACTVLIPCSCFNFPVDSLQTQKSLQIYSGVFVWLNKERSEKGQRNCSIIQMWPKATGHISLSGSHCLPEVVRKNERHQRNYWLLSVLWPQKHV